MGKRKAKKKSYYKKMKRGKFERFLLPGMKGFLITCGNKAENDAVRDAYNILNEYADKLYGPENTTDVSILCNKKYNCNF